MEFFVQKSRLQEELGKLAGIIEKKSAVQILECVLIKPNGIGIELLATNIEQGIHITTDVDQIAGTDSICTPFRRFHDIVKSMPDGAIKIWTDANGWVKIAAKGSNFRIPGHNATSFPELAIAPAEDAWITVSAKLFTALMRGVEFAMATEQDKRYTIEGIKVEINSTGIKMVATNGSRLALAQAPLDLLLLNNIDLLLPRKAVTELLKFIPDTDVEISIAITDYQMFFRVGKRMFYSRLLTGQFPSYEILFNQTYPHFTTLQPDVFVPSVKRALLVADERLSGIVMHFKDKKVHLLASTADEGECNEVLDSDFNGEEVRIACSGDYLLDFLDKMGKEKVWLEIKDANTQLSLKAQRGNIYHQYVVMAMRDK